MDSLEAHATETESTKFLIGWVCDLSGADADGWRRRELNIKRAVDGYPEVRDVIHLIDSEGNRYHGLPFVKGARFRGYTCLGMPKALKPWFLRHYDFNDAKKRESVYLESTGQRNEYRLYTEPEWMALKAAG